MASFDLAIAYVLGNEGGLFESKTTGEVTNFGISLKWMQAAVDPSASANTIRALTASAATDLYKTHWWDRYNLRAISSNRLATKIFDAMVNMGPQTAIKLYQAVLNEVDAVERVRVDGWIGNEVMMATNEELSAPNGEDALLLSFCAECATHYEEIAAEFPVHEGDLPGWLRRAEKVPV